MTNSVKYKQSIDKIAENNENQNFQANFEQYG